MNKPKIIEIIRSVPIAGKTYEEYVEALAERYVEEAKKLFDEIESCIKSRTWYGKTLMSFEVDAKKFARLKNNYTKEKR